MLLVGQIVSWDVELERAVEGHVEDLKTLANCQNRQPARERASGQPETPSGRARGRCVYPAPKGRESPGARIPGKYRNRLRVKGRPSHRVEHFECARSKL